MFSSTPQVNGSSTNSARGSRRRQRPLSNEGSIAQPKAKRQRSALSEHTFQALNGDAAPEMEEVKEKAVSVVRRESTRDILVPAPRREIAVRGKKAKTSESKSGDGLVLTTNDTYTVSKLPALPDRLRTEAPAKQHGAIYSDSGYALAITHEHAMVWPYAANVPSPETFTFTLPHPSKHGSDALPLGSLVSASASSAEPGLVVVMPNTGVITYWESIASAATLDLIRQQRNGVELSIPGMLSGETVVQILNAETAGFVLGFSTGRLAYMSVRDGQGRPAISVQFLRNSSGPSSRGILGSLRNVLSISNLRGDIAAVRAGPAEKVGERNVVVATTKGKLQAWNLHRGGHNSLQSDADGREAIVVAIKDANPDVSELLLESFEVLDFTFTPQLVVDSQLGDGLAAGSGKGVHLLLLTSLTGRETTHYFLVEVVLKPEEFMIGTIRTMKSYTTSISRISTSKARLYLPSPALMAFIVFDRAVVLMSMAKQHNSPESQLRAESHLITRSFEDVVDFREDLNVEIVGSGNEEPYGPSHGIEDSKSRRHKAKYPAAVLLVRGGGIVRVAATDVSKLVTSAPQVTAKSKLEQAVFFGTVAENPLSFVGRRELQFEPEELGVAAMELSADILKSATPWIPSVPASLEQNLKKRSAALRDLALHLKSTGVTRKLDRVVRWQLLWDAEKMAAAEEIWTTYNARLKAKPDGQKRGLLTEIIEFIHEDYKTSPVPEIGELDRVRLWFIKDIWNLEIAIPWAYQVIKFTYQDGQKDLASIMDLVSQANDVILGALGGAFAFRTAHTNLYGLQSENLEHGVITTGQDRLPDAWTSSFFITENLRKQAELTGMLLQDAQKGVGHEGQPSQALFDKLRHEAPSVIDLCIRANTERIAWDSAQDNPQCQLQADQIKLLQAASEHNQLILLASGVAGLPDEAMALAEKHCILPVLAEILMSEIVFAMKKQRSLSEGTEDYEHWAKRASDLQTRAKDEFTRFGTRWANALFEYHVSIGAMEELLEKYQDQQAFLTSFLRSRPEYAKVAWINEVTREKDLDKAAETLIELGLQREQDVWSKKVELSLGKLARLAGKKNYSQTNGILIPDGGKAELSATNDQLALLKIQDQIYEHILPSISAAIDDNAEFQLAMEAHGNKKLLRSKAFASFLEDNMNHLIRHEAMGAAALIDLLTLMGENGRGREPGSIRGQEFYLALEASRHGLPRDDAVMLQEVIWRRCFLRDDWSKVNNTDGKDDDEVSEQLRQTALYSTLRGCFKNRLFDPDTNIKPLGPMDVLEASTEELDGRFNGLDGSIRESIMKDMEVEADALKPFIDTCQLEKWHQSAIEVAKSDFETEVFSKTDDGQVMQEVALRLQDIENDIRESQVERANTLLHSKPRFRPGASTKGNASFRASLKLY